jgi:outer membrane protein
MGSNMTSTKRLSTLGSRNAALLIGLSAVFFAGAAIADDAIPANTLRVGMYFVKYNASASNLSGPFTPPGINLRVDHVNTPYFAYLRRLSPSWELEIAAGIPPKTHTRGVGPAYLGSVPFNGQEVATAKWFSPTVLLEYKFLEERSAFRPYVGVGVNYTHFSDRNSTAAGDAANGGPTQTYLSDSVGPAATAGVSYKFTKHCNAIASYSIAQVNSTYDSVTSGISRRTEVHFNPATWVVAVGYSF